MTDQKIARFIRHLSTGADHCIAALYRVNPPMSLERYTIQGIDFEITTTTSSYVRVSASMVPVSGPETYIFLADEHGSVINWLECDGSFQGRLNFLEALHKAGYTVEGEPYVPDEACDDDD